MVWKPREDDVFVVTLGREVACNKVSCKALY